jgi:hypothetical protein
VLPRFFKTAERSQEEAGRHAIETSEEGLQDRRYEGLIVMNAPGNSLAALAGLPGLSGLFGDIVKAPITRWNQSSMLHKVVAAGAGAGLAYYLHTRGMADAAVAVAGVGGAYVASMMMHYPSMARQVAMGVPANGQAVQALPPAQVAAMNGMAQQMMQQGLAGYAPIPMRPGAVPAPRAPGIPVQPMQPVQPPQSGVATPGSKWGLLDLAM